MTNKVRVIAVIVAIIILFTGVIFFMTNHATKKAVQNFNQLIAKFDKTAKLDYKKIKVRGGFKPQSLTCFKCHIKGQKLNLAVEKLDVDIKDPKNLVFLLNDVTYIKGDEHVGKTSIGYQITTKDTIKITSNHSEKDSNYTITLPQTFFFISPYEEYLIKYNQKETPVYVTLKDNMLQSIEYKDEGLNIYDKDEEEPNQDNYISKTNANILNISSEVEDGNHSFNVYLKSNDNIIMNNSENNNMLHNSFFSLLIDVKYHNTKPENLKTLDIANIDISFAKVKFHLDGKLIQDNQNYIPYGKLNFTMEEYKKFITDFYDSLDDAILPENTPDILRIIKENPEDQKTKALTFLEKINNNSDVETLTINIDRQPSGVPFINGVSINDVTKTYKEIFQTSSSTSSPTATNLDSTEKSEDAPIINEQEEPTDEAPVIIDQPVLQ